MERVGLHEARVGHVARNLETRVVCQLFPGLCHLLLPFHLPFQFLCFPLAYLLPKLPVGGHFVSAVFLLLDVLACLPPHHFHEEDEVVAGSRQ